MTMFASFLGPSYTASTFLADCERTINLYRERMESAGATTPAALVSVPGLESYATSALSPIRAQFAQDGRAFAVIGFAFFEITDDGDGTGSLTLRGTVDNDGLPATISSSGDAGGELFITAGGTGYVYTLSTDTLAAVASAGSGLIQGGYLDGYFLALDDTSTFKISDLLTGPTWDPTQIVQRSDAPDRWLAVLVVGKYIWLWGSETTSVLYDAGAFPFPFALVPGVLINSGIAAPFSAADLNGAPVWLASMKAGGRMIVRAEGFGTPTRISNHALEYALSQYATVSDAVAHVFEWNGHWFYQINFPTANASWVFDASTNEWAERLLWNEDTAEWECARSQYHCVFADQHLVGDRATGDIYRLSASTYTDAGGAPLRRQRRVPFPRLTESADFIFLSEFQVYGDVGVGLSTGQGSDPQVMLRISRDGGRTFGNELWSSMGAIGKWLTRVIWNRCGRFRDGFGVVEVTVSDPVPVRFTGASFLASKGTS